MAWLASREGLPTRLNELTMNGSLARDGDIPGNRRGRSLPTKNSNFILKIHILYKISPTKAGKSLN